MPEQLKQLAFRSVGAAERLARRVGGDSVSLQPRDLRAIRNFLLPLFDPWLGTTVHETPVLEALRAAVPDARIVAAVSGLPRQVLEHHPAPDSLVPVPDPNRDFRGAVAGLRGIVNSFRGEPWCALFTSWNSRSRVALATMLSGSGVRAGFGVAPELLHLHLPYDPNLSQKANNLKLPGLLGYPISTGLEPRIYFSQADLEHARTLTGAADTRPSALLITRTSGGQPTAWPDRRFVDVARHLVARWDCRILLPGVDKDGEALTRLAAEIGPAAQSLAGATTIAQLAAICALSDIAVSVDTGAMHVARSQGLPLVIIAPAWQNSIEWMPLDKAWARILKGPWFAPPPPPSYAIEEISVELVIEKAEELLAAFPPSIAGRENRLQRSLSPAGRPSRLTMVG